jgi:S1-C subfamily serine protease
MDRFRGWSAGLLALALALLSPLTAQAQAYNKERFWEVGTSEGGDYCMASAKVDGGLFLFSVADGQATFGFVSDRPLRPARKGVIELGPYAFDFVPMVEKNTVVMDDNLNAKAREAVFRADSIGLRLDGHEVVSMGLDGTGYQDMLYAVGDCAAGKSGWWGKGAAAPSKPAEAPHGDSSGTGFFVTPGGVGVTNAHVVNGCKTITSPRWGAVTVLAVDKVADLAVFKTERSGPDYVALRSRSPKLGEPLTVAGFPLLGLLGDGVRITTGVVSALSGVEGDRSRFQISAPIQPGNSGGPIIDASGQLIGVSVSGLRALEIAKQTDGMIPQNVNFGVPATILQSFLDENGVRQPAKAPSGAGVDAMPLYTFSLLCKGS